MTANQRMILQKRSSGYVCRRLELHVRQGIFTSTKPIYKGDILCLSKIRCLVNRYWDHDIKLVFTTCKLRNIFLVKDSVPRELRSRVIYKFTCACCNAFYTGETGRHFSTRVRELTSLFRQVLTHLQTFTKLRTLSSILPCGLLRNPWFCPY